MTLDERLKEIEEIPLRGDIDFLLAVVRVQKEALEFYGDKSMYTTPIEEDHWKSIIVDDEGETARAAREKCDALARREKE